MTKGNFAVIPARGGSKGLPGKNKRILAGKPLILHTVDAAMGSNRFEEIIVSTDDPDIVKLLNNTKYESVIVNQRPEYLATDTTEMYDVIEYIISEYSISSESKITLLQPTSPLRDSKDIESALDCLLKSDFKSLISVVEIDKSVYKSCFLQDGKLVGIRSNDLLFKNRQSLPKAYKPNGAIYVYSVESLNSKKCFHLEDTYAFIMSESKSLDIDNIADFNEIEGILT